MNVELGGHVVGLGLDANKLDSKLAAMDRQNCATSARIRFCSLSSVSSASLAKEKPTAIRERASGTLYGTVILISLLQEGRPPFQTIMPLIAQL